MVPHFIETIYTSDVLLVVSMCIYFAFFFFKSFDIIISFFVSICLLVLIPILHNRNGTTFKFYKMVPVVPLFSIQPKRETLALCQKANS